MIFFTSSLNFGILHLQTFAVCSINFGRLLFAAYNINDAKWNLRKDYEKGELLQLKFF